MERPTTEQNEFNCDVADGIRMSGVTTASNKIRSIKLIMARQYEGGSSVMVTRVFRWLEAIYFVVQSLDPLMTKDSTKELVTTLGIVGGEGRKPDLKNLNSVTEKNGFKYVAFTRNDPPMLEFSATNGRETAEADTSRTPAISQSTEQETNSRSSNEKDVYTVTDDYTTVFDSETACAAYDTDNQWNAPNVNAISEIKGKWTSTDSLAKGAKVRILEKRGKCARVEVLSGSMAVDGRGSGWMSLNMLTETRAVMPPEQVLRSSHSEPNPAQPSSVPVRSNVQATASDSAALIDKILEAEKGSDESSINEIKTRLTAIPKPVPGDGAEATRLNKIGLQALKTKEYQTAVTYFQSASNADPSDAKLLSNLGFAEMNVGNLNAARKHLNLSIASDPTRAVAWGDLGLVFAKTGEQDKAVSALLVGYRVSNGKTLNFLESLAKDDDPAFHEAGSIALSKVSSLPGLSHGPSAAGASSGAPTHGDGMSVPASAPTRVGRSAGGGSGGGSTVAIKPSANADGNGVPNANDPFASSSPSPKIDYEAFMKDLERRIKRAWFPPKFEEPKTMTVKFRVHQGGALSDLEIKDSSGSSIDDQAALKAVENASPFRPLPSGSEENIEIIFKFDDTNRSSRSTHGVISN
jgi:TonB family protein